MADGSVVFSISADDADAQKKLNELRKDIEKTQKQLNSKEEKRSGISESLAQAREEAKKTADEIAEIRRQMADNQLYLTGMKGDISPDEFAARNQAKKENEYELAQQQKLYAKQTQIVAGLEKQEQNLTGQIEKQTAQLRQQKEEAGAIERTLSSQATSSMPKIGEAVGQVTKSIRSGVKSILKWGLGIRSVFVLARRLRSAIKEGINDYAAVDPETKANMDALKTALNGVKASFGAAFAPVANVVIPIIAKLCGWLQKAIEYIGMFFSALQGNKTFKKAIANNEALAKSYGGAGAAAKDAKKQLMGFDEINKLNEESGGGGGGGAGGLADYVDEEIPGKFAKVVQAIKDNIQKIEAIVGPALIAIGAILLFTWAAPLVGLAMIAAGFAMTYNVAANWNALPEETQQEISRILFIVGKAILVIGAILAFSGVAIPAGIALMAIGAASMAGAVALNWNAIKQKLEGPLGLILSLLGGSLLVIGFILVCTGVAFALGFGLMVAGGAALGVGATNYNWTALLDKIKGVWDNITNWWNKNVAKFFTKEYWQQKISSVINSIQIPHIKLPHIQISWEPANGWMADALSFFGIPANVPHINVSWYAKGGIVDGATLIGAGEQGKEAIVPLEKNTEWIKTVANGIIDGLTGSDRLADYISGRVLPSVASGYVVPPRAVSGGGSMFTDGDIQKLVNGLVAAFSADGNDQTTKIYLDGREIAEAVTKHQRRMERGFA